MRIHIFPTGSIQVDKSTITPWAGSASGHLCLRFLHGAGAVGCGWQRQHSHRSSIRSCFADSGNPNLAAAEVYLDREIRAFPDVFDTVGFSLLKNVSRCSLIIMDEISISENTAAAFPQTLLERLGGNIPILGVVRDR